MSKILKLYEKISRQPTPPDIRFDEIDKLMIYYGFERRQPSRGGSHYIYTHPKIETRPTIPKNNPVRRAYIKQAIQAIEHLREIEAGRMDDE